MVMTASSAHVQGIVLAGVHAWGESRLEQVCCRPLLPVLGRPLVWYVLDWLGRHGISRASICANSDTGVFRQCLGTGGQAGVGLSYYADLMPRGPAGCMRDAAAGSGADTLVVVDGTIVTRVNLADLLAAHHGSGAGLTVVVAGESDSAPAEPTGIYVVSRAALEHIPAKGYQDIKEMLIPRLYEAGQRVVPYDVAAGEVLRVTSAASYLSVVEWALREPGAFSGEYNRIGRAIVHRTSYIARSTRLMGAVLVGPDCAIEDGATLLGPTVVGPGSLIGRRAVVSRTSIWPDCRVLRGAFVDHCILTSGTRIDEQVAVRDTVCMPSQEAGEWRAVGQLYWSMMDASRVGVDVREEGAPAERRMPGAMAASCAAMESHEYR